MWPGRCAYCPADNLDLQTTSCHLGLGLVCPVMVMMMTMMMMTMMMMMMMMMMVRGVINLTNQQHAPQRQDDIASGMSVFQVMGARKRGPVKEGEMGRCL
jgi:hypothetical protein